jgi:predicted nucleotidyltransferase
MPANSNKELIKVVAMGLGELLPEVVFIGGATTELYATDDREIFEVRMTDDVDCVIHIATRWKMAEFEEKLRKQKFVNDLTKIMRWNYAGIIVDVMPDDEAILGFSNPWYTEGITNAIDYVLTDKLSIRIFTLPYFLATKFTALFDRGMNDLRLSKDLEDIVFCFYYNQGAGEEIRYADKTVREYLRDSITRLLKEPVTEEAIYATLPGGEVEEENVKLVLERLREVLG